MTDDTASTLKHLRRRIFAAGFFLTLGAALSYYVNSSFLEGLVGKSRIGLVYIAAALLAIGLISFTSRLARRFGLVKPSRVLAAIVTVGYLGLSLITAATFQLTIFIITHAAVVSLGLWLDLYLESLSLDRHTGRIRGGYLTLINAAILLAPFASGETLNYSGDYRLIYLLSFIAVLPLLYLLLGRLAERQLPLNQFSFREKIRDLNLQRIIGIDFLLNLFYFVMVVYLPLHLHETLGFNWEQIGFIFTIMLLPFVLIQYALGWLADRRFGEKEILIAGLLIAGLSTLPVAGLTSRRLALWALLLFLTRVGASAWEAMKESYLFKRVNAGDTEVISLSRLMVPFAYLVGSIASAIFLRFLPLEQLFFFLGLLIIASVFFIVRLADTR
ncbi:MAG: MFS transporter [Candidatus Vogelbacteria bacterium]|nr:MFS transporter [Candidatus Vogelbacteria bacterium]